MEEGWRNFLYPIGFLANILFALRFIVQWISSEQKKISHLSESFWAVSLAGSALLALHSFIQLQYPILLIQTCNTVLYCRNLQLMRYPKPLLISFRNIFLILFVLLIVITGLFMLESWWSFGYLEWMRVPGFMDKGKVAVSFMWTFLGFTGTFLFASRFWIHWWRAEKGVENPLKADFWVISLVGSILALCYFIRIQDLVNIIGYSAGMVPYIRNMMIMRRPNRV